MDEWDAKLIGIAKELKRLLAERGMAPSDSDPMDCDEVESACKVLQTGMDLNEGNITHGEYYTSLYDVGNPTDEELKEIEESINGRAPN